MTIEIDLEYIRKMAEERRDENWKFRSFLKQLDMPTGEIDAIVHEILDDVASLIDCTKCANCCDQIRPVLDSDDIARFAAGLQIPVSQLEEDFLDLAGDNNPERGVFKRLPCPFLQNKLCTNYEHRPEGCRSYPHLHKKGFVSRLWGVVENYGVCPIVFHVYERLKTQLWHFDDFHDYEFERL